MNKKLLLISVTFIVIVILVVLIFIKKSPISTGPTAPPTLAIPAPTSIFVQPANVVFSFISPPLLPTSLPTYSFQPISLATVEQIAGNAAVNLGLGSTPSALTRGNSYTKTWSRPNEAVLTVTQTEGSINTIFRQAKSNKLPGALTPDVATQQFLSIFIPPATNLSVAASGTTNGPFDGMLVLDTPTPTAFKGYSYSYTLSSYPVLTPDLSIAPIFIVTDSGGIIRFASITPPPSTLQEEKAISLLNHNQILDSLAAGRGTLLDTHSPLTPERGVVPNFS